MYPELSQFLFHPEVDAFKDIPRVPGDSISEDEIPQDPAAMEQPLLEQCTETWSNNGAGRDVYGHVPHVPYEVPPPSAQAAAVMEDLRLTDQELDGILELQEEI